MKRFSIGITITALTLLGFATSLNQADVDNCKAYFPLEKGTELTYESYNSKDKLESTDYFTVKDLVQTGEKLTILVSASSVDKKGEKVFDSEFNYSCENGVFKMSMESLMNGQNMEAYEGMEITVTQTELEIPSTMTIGQSLPDANMNMKVASNGIAIMSMDFMVTDRKVEGIESITTAAGTFDCYKLSQSTNVKMMFMNKTYKSVDWIAANIGAVRSESYDSDGSLESYRILTNIKH